MATIPASKKQTPATLTKFLGLNVNETGDTQIKTGESANMTNFYITKDYKLKKMYGYKKLDNYGNWEVRGIYGAKVGGHGYLLVAAKDQLYYYRQEELEDDENLDELTTYGLGTIGETDCSFFEFDDKVYILAGDYYSWDGTTFKTVEGYIPCVMISTTPTGSGTIYEEINMLTPKRHQTFNGNGSATTYNLAEDNITSVDKIFVNGSREYDFTSNLSAGTVTFTSGAPSSGTDNVDIYYSKANNDRSIIANMRFGTVFGGNFDTRVFLYGNPSCQNRVYFSQTEYVGDNATTGVEYFPATNQVDIGPANYAVTDLTRQYDRLLATTNKPEAYYLTISTEELNVTLSSNETATRYVPSVSTYPLNEIHGNVAFGQGQVLNNFPITIDKTGFTLWKQTNVRDERNVENISTRIQQDLVDLDMSLFKTLEVQTDNQMWFANENKIYIYNYENDTFSRLVVPHEVAGFAELGKNIYMIAPDEYGYGTLYKWDKKYFTYDGNIIHAHWEMNFSDFGASYLRKTMRKLWVQMQPSFFASASIGYITNVMTSPVTKYISYRISPGFDDVDFNNFSFQLSVNPQPFRLKLKAKKFTNMKITIDNNENSSCVILGITIKAEAFGESK